MDNNLKYLKSLGDNLRKLRDQLGISQQELADNSNVAKSTIQRIEKGEMNPSIITLRNISSAMGIDIIKLIKK